MMSTFKKQHWNHAILKNHDKMNQASALVCFILASALQEGGTGDY